MQHDIIQKKKDEKNVTKKKKIKIQASTPYAKVYSHKIANKAFRYFEWSRFFFSSFFPRIMTVNVPLPLAPLLALCVHCCVWSNKAEKHGAKGEQQSDVEAYAYILIPTP